MKTPALSVVFWLLTLLGFVRADGLIVVRRPPHPAPHIRPPHAFAPLEVAFHKVSVEIDGQKARTHVEQEFVNPNAARLEGEYIFPIPKGAHIDRFSMRIGDRDIEAELLDAEKARGIYEDIVRRQRDPALLEYTGRGAFRVRIFPIEPRERKKVTLTYTELLKADGGLISYLYPLNTEKFSAEPLRSASIHVEIRHDSPIKALYSPSHPVEIRRKDDRRAVASWEAQNVRPDTDFQLLFSTSDSDVGIHLLTHKSSRDEGWFLLLASPGTEPIKDREANPKDVVFVLDTSGSMAGRKLEQAKKALTFCIENLNDNDRFEVIRFATEAEPLFDSLRTASRENRDRATEFVRDLKSIGGTAIHEALQKALALEPNQPARTRQEPDGAPRPFIVVFLTDGQPTVGETNEDRIVASVTRDEPRKRTEPVTPSRIFCFGIGTDVNTHLLDKIAEKTRAATQFVLENEDLEVKVSSFFLKIREPLLTNVNLVFPESVRVSKLYPHPLPDLFRGDQLVLVGRYTGSGEGMITLEGTRNGQHERLTQRVHFSESNRDNEFVPQLWATRRVGWMLDEIRLRGESRELRDEVVELARRYAIVTPYTSYLIVEDEIRRNVPVTRRSLQNLDRNRHAQAYLRDSYGTLPREKTGDGATYDARANSALKNAQAPAPAKSSAQAEAKKAIVSKQAPGSSAKGRVDRELDEVEQAARVVRGKSFFQNGDQWLDAEVQKKATGRQVRVQFASEEYFDLLKKNADAAEWLALGRNVQFAIGDTVYEIHE